MARLPAKFALLLLGVFLSAAGLELALQLASTAFHAAGYRAVAPKRKDGRVVLCVGDSYTYGTSVPRKHSYPAQLEDYLNRRDPDGRYQVVNRGVPGMNSTQAVEALPIWLAQTKPDLVVVWIGANNWWNWAAADLDTSRVDGSLFSRLLTRSRLLRLVHMLQIDAEWRETLGDAGALHERILEQLKPSASTRRARSTFEFIDVTNNDLAALSAILEAQNVEWMLVAYPHSAGQRSKAKQMLLRRAAALRDESASDESQVPENSRGPARFAIELHREVVRDFSLRESIPFVNTREDFTRANAAHPAAKILCEPGSSELEMASCLFVSAMGPHPTGLLYGFIAKSIGRTVMGQLGCVGACTLDR